MLENTQETKVIPLQDSFEEQQKLPLKMPKLEADILSPEHKLKEIKDRLQVIFDNIGDGISVIDNAFKILRVNQGILNLFAKSRFQDLLENKCFSEYFKNEVICENCPAQKAFADGQSYHTTKVWHAPDKKQLVLDISCFPIKDEKDRVIQVIEHIKDITNRVKLEDQLLYQERLAGIGELAAGIAHEIRNPLGSIAASSQFCLSKYNLNNSLKRHLRLILKNSENANRIIKDLLDFAKPREIIFQKANLGEVIKSSLNLVRVRCVKQRVRLVLRISRRLPPLLLDEKRMEQVFLNFILNALDAMPNGGKLIISAYPDFNTNETVVSFLDTGEGISLENLDKLFTPFFSTKQDGVGLGLCLAHQVISYHKGNIKIESKLGQGTELMVRLPFAH